MRNSCRGVRTAILFASLLCAAFAGCKAVETPPATTRHVFYPLPPDPPRVQYLTAINAAREIIPKKSAGFIEFLLGAPTDILESPQGVAGPALRSRRLARTHLRVRLWRARGQGL